MNGNSSEREQNRFHGLLMKAVDGELTAAEEAEFEQYMERDEARRREWATYSKLKEVIMSLDFKNPPREVWERYWKDIYNRIERGVGWILLSLGCVILFTYGSFKGVESLINDPQLGLVLKGGILVVLTGLFILFISAAREKYFTWKRDKYREVKR